MSVELTEVKTAEKLVGATAGQKVVSLADTLALWTAGRTVAMMVD